MRMIHALPMRALTNQLEQRMGEYSRRTSPRIRVAAQHGKRPESVLFYADAIFATLDQVVSSYACAPLSLSVRQGNIPAGAIPGSFMVFDEVHTFEPQLGLQCVLLLAERAKALGVPFVLMSATLPTSLVESLQERFEAELIEVNEEDIPGRRQRRVTVHIDEELAPGTVLELASQDEKKTLVVVNTVGRAIELYDAVRKHWDCPIILAHSRFYDDDRKKKEKQIEALFGKGSPEGKAVLIATQVVEVGLDISCDCLLTELAPIDALVQRAGRCARWGGPGDVFVFTELTTAKPYPYEEAIVSATQEALVRHGADGKRLTWKFEKTLVDEVLNEPFEKLAEPEAAGGMLAKLAEAAFTGSPAKAESAVREGISIAVALHDNPRVLHDSVFRLPKISLRPSTLAGFLKRPGARGWQIDLDRNAGDDYRPKPVANEIRAGARLRAGSLYAIDPAFANYSEDYGLRFGIPGTPEQPRRAEARRKRELADLKPELWEDHTRKVVEAFQNVIYLKERHAFAALARLLGKSENELLTLVKLTLIFHDLGKLTTEWQKKIKEGLENQFGSDKFLAHRGGPKPPGLPPHATISAYAAWDFLESSLGNWGKAAALAMAHHHSVGATSVPAYRISARAPEVVQAIWNDGNRTALTECMRRRAEQQSTTNLPMTMPPFHRVKEYTLYLMLSRWLRLSDRIATGGGEHAILDYEEWAGSF
jgi:CRISPR-associated endonuclease/helicase Cas3